MNNSRILVELKPHETVGVFSKGVITNEVLSKGDYIRAHDLIKASISILSFHADGSGIIELDEICQLMSVLNVVGDLMDNAPSTSQILGEYHTSVK